MVLNAIYHVERWFIHLFFLKSAKMPVKMLQENLSLDDQLKLCLQVHVYA